MFVINILGFVSLNCILAYHYKEKIVTVFPVSMGIWLLVLYALAFFQKLSYIDAICVLLIVFGVICIVWKKNNIKCAIKGWIDPSTIMLLVILFLIWLVVQNKLAYGNDELGVWALEVKDMFYVNGFADKYKNLSMGYGNYFPGQMLLEWWTCHFSPREFQEGLMYVGYWWIYIAFMAPVLGKLPISRRYAIPWGIGAGALFMVIPSMVDAFGYTQIIAEMPLSAAFGGCLWAAFDSDEHTKGFIFLRFMMSMTCLMMFKETGIIFALMALVFYIGVVHVRKNGNESKNRSAELLGCRYGMCAALLAGIPVLIWKVYCKVYERNTYFTYIFQNTFDNISENTYTLSELAFPLTKSFFKALLVEPLHVGKTIGIDLTVWAFILLVGIALYCLCKKNVMNLKEARFLGKYYIVMLVIYLILLLGMHIFIFQEGGYVETNIMMVSIARYAEPLFLGVLIFLVLNGVVVLEKSGIGRSSRTGIVCICLGIILCADVVTVWKYVVGYSPVNAATLADRKTVEEKAQAFVDELEEKMNKEEQGRILWVRNDDDAIYGAEWRKISYILAPKSLVAYYVDISQLDEEDFRIQIWSYVKDSHCGYVYFDDIDSEYLASVYDEEDIEMKNVLLEVLMDENGNISFKEVEK